MVKIIATIERYQHKNQNEQNALHDEFLAKLDKDGIVIKKLSPKKFYFLYYQMTELIPLFSYLERLNALKFTISMTDTGEDLINRKLSLM